MTICIIPARGGSKRIPKKNIKKFFGRPMIAWSIEAAQKSKIFSRIIVSTDDDEIAAIANSLGADVPFMRPQELADDYTSTGDVMAHACRWIVDEGMSPEVICCLYPTAPFIQSSDLEQALAIMATGNWEYVFTVGEYASPVFRSFTQDPAGGVKMLFPECFETRSQDLDNVYHDAGMFYMGMLDAWIMGARVLDKHAIPMKIPSWRVQDIDTPEDWRRAELMYQVLMKNGELD